MEHDPYRCAVLSFAGGEAGKVVVAALIAAGHRIVAREAGDDAVEQLAPILERWVGDAIDVVIVTGGDELAPDDAAADALASLTTRRLPGFGEAVRAISLQKLGVPALLNRATAAVCGHTIVIALPGPEELVEAVLDALIVPQLAASGATLGGLLARTPRPREEHRTKPPPIPPRRPTVSPPVVAAPPPPPPPAPTITTGSIATIGDLPTFTYDAAADLRRGRRRTSPWLALLAILAMCASVAAAVVVVLHGRVEAEPRERMPATGASDPVPVAVPVPGSAPDPVPVPDPVPAPAPAPAPTHHHTLAAHPAAPTPTPDADPMPEDGCDQVSCVLTHYERDCCAPFKPAEPPPPKPAGPPDGLDRAMVQAGMADIKPRVSQCGDQSRAKGTVKLHVEVDAAGAVTSLEVRDTPDAALGACVAAAARSAHFAATQHGGNFTFPYVF